MSILLAILLTAGTFFVFYRLALRPILLDRIRFKIFKLRDDLRDMAIRGDIKPTLFAYKHLERSLCKLITLVPALNMYQFTQFVLWQKFLPEPSSREMRFEEVALPKLREIDNEAVLSMFWVILVNSPLGAVLLVPALLILKLAAKVNADRKEWLARRERQLTRKGHQFLDHEVGELELAAAA
jgi:hypothetical protein